MLQLPPYEIDAADQQPIYDYSIQLDDVEYRIKLTYRTRQDRWYMDLYDSDDEILVHGVKLIIDTTLLQDLVLETLPPGRLALYDSSGLSEECGELDLGTRCLLLYIPEDEIPEAESTDLEIVAV